MITPRAAADTSDEMPFSNRMAGIHRFKSVINLESPAAESVKRHCTPSDVLTKDQLVAEWKTKRKHRALLWNMLLFFLTMTSFSAASILQVDVGPGHTRHTQPKQNRNNHHTTHTHRPALQITRTDTHTDTHRNTYKQTQTHTETHTNKHRHTQMRTHLHKHTHRT